MTIPLKRTVLVTGGTRGIGRACVELFALNGYRVVFCYKNSEELADGIAAKLTAKGCEVLSFRSDVSDYREVRELYNYTKKTFGFVDTIINNAGVSQRKLFIDTDLDDFNYIVGQNLSSVYNVTKLYLPDMLSNLFGRVINISSVFGKSGAAMESLYSSTKGAINALTAALSKEYINSGVTFNAVAPGLVDTDMNACLTNEEKEEFLLNNNAKKITAPIDIAKKILKLARAAYK